MRTPRRNHRVAFRARGAFAGLKDCNILVGLAGECDTHGITITHWHARLVETAKCLFLTPANRAYVLASRQ